MVELYRVTVKKPSTGYSPYFVADTSGEIHVTFERELDALVYYEYYKNLGADVTFEITDQNGQS